MTTSHDTTREPAVLELIASARALVASMDELRDDKSRRATGNSGRYGTDSTRAGWRTDICQRNVDEDSERLRAAVRKLED